MTSTFIIDHKNKSQTLIQHILTGMSWSNWLCSTFGHRWRYRNYSNHIQSSGEKYDFKAARDCKRCGQYSYFHNSWQNAVKLKLDYENNYYASDSIVIDGVKYN